ncbi:MAG: penicillin acylase family protein [Candidatus Helarchaeota archaeon]
MPKIRNKTLILNFFLIFMTSFLVLNSGLIIENSQRYYNIDSSNSTSLHSDSFPDSLIIYRDQYGVPHIFADNEEALFFGFGYAQAQDHLIGMLLNYHKANGSMAATFGGAENFTQDLLIHRLMNPKICREHFSDLDSRIQNVCNSFAEGVNTYITEHISELPNWVKNITGIEIMAFSRYYSIMESYWDTISPGSLTEFGGMCNQWIINGSYTTSGYPILTFDIHLPWTDEFAMYEAHLNCPTYNVMGATFFGLPLIFEGHNDYIGWSMHSNHHDIGDLWNETLNETNLGYKYKGLWYPVESFQVELQNKTDSGVVDTLNYNIYKSRHGIELMNDTDNHWSIVYNSTTLYQFKGLEELYKINTAKNLTQFKEALEMLQITANDFCYADIEGNIYSVYQSRLPVRENDTVDWLQPLDAKDGYYEWNGIHNFTDFPYFENPDTPYIQDCNDAPQYAWFNCPLNSSEYPWYMIPEGFGRRGQRLNYLLNGTTTFDIDIVKNYSFDNFVTQAYYLIPILNHSIVNQTGQYSDPNLTIATHANLLINWDMYATLDSCEMSLFRNWTENLFARNISFSPSNIPSPYNTSNEDQLECIYALNDTINEFNATFNTTMVPWGDIHIIRRGNQTFKIATGDRATQTIWMGENYHCINGTWYIEGGSSYMMVIDLTPPISAWSLRPYGESEDPNSTHYTDLTSLFTNSTYKEAWFHENDVKEHVEGAWGKTIYFGTANLGYLATINNSNFQYVEIDLSSTAIINSSGPSGLKRYSNYLTLNTTPNLLNIYLQFNYNPNRLLLGSEEFLGIYHYSELNHKWEKCNQSGINNNDNYVWAITNETGTYALFYKEDPLILLIFLDQLLPSSMFNKYLLFSGIIGVSIIAIIIIVYLKKTNQVKIKKKGN